MKYTKEILVPIIKNVDCQAELMRRLNIRISGGMYAHLKKMIKLHKINISHWKGYGANKGKIIPRKSHKEILAIRPNGYKEHTRRLLRALLQSGVPYECNRCGINKWMDKFIRLQIEHKNGNSLDNRKRNLELLCPNCHTQTDTYGVLKINRNTKDTNKLSYDDLTQKMIEMTLNGLVDQQQSHSA